MTRALAAARLYVVNKWMLIWIPLIILGSMIALTVAIQLVVLATGAARDTVGFNGAFQAGFWCLLAVAVAASTQMFPFAFAMSLTRRDFVFGTLLVAAGVGIGYGATYGLVSWIEHVSDGFGIGAHSFTIVGFVGRSWPSAFVFYGGVILLMFMLGFASSMLYKRFGFKGLVVAGVACAVLLTVLGAWVALSQAWTAIGRWFMTQTPVSIGLYALVVSALLAGASYLLIRHAEP